MVRQELKGIQSLKHAPRRAFKVTYDQNNLYLAFASTVEPAWNTRRWDTTAAWRQIAGADPGPQGQRQSITISSLISPKSFYDAAFGLVTDTLDPRYNKSDPSQEQAPRKYQGEIKEGCGLP